MVGNTRERAGVICDNVDDVDNIDVDDVVGALEAGLKAAAADVDAEQAVRGLDHQKELELQALLASSLERAGFFVAREQRYPADRTKKQRSSGRRCDLVVTRAGPLLLEDAQPGLWNGPAQLPQQALWIEVKVLKQFLASGPNFGWAEALSSPPTQEIARLSGDVSVGAAAQLLLLFTASPEVAEHDAAVWRSGVVARGLFVRAPAYRHIPISDRLGNTTLTLCFLPVSSPWRLG